MPNLSSWDPMQDTWQLFDTRSGATLGDFKSESFGIGAGFVWIPKAGGGRLRVLGRWMHDFSAQNRFESDYFTPTGAWRF